MANPNLLSVTTVNAKVYQAALTTTLTTDLVTCASSHLYKIESITVANYDGTNTTNLTLGLIKSGGSVIYIASTIPVPANSSITLKEMCPIYLEEGDLIEGGASANSDLAITINYLDMS